MSRGFRICMTKGGRGCLRRNYGRPKLTLVTRFDAAELRCNTSCILWPVRFFVTLWEWTGSISRNLVVTKSLLNFGFLPLNRKYRGFPGLHGNRNNRNGGTKKGEVDISPEFIADVDWTHKLFSLQTSNHGNLEICWKRPLTAWSQVWWRIFLFVQLLGVFGTFWTF